MAGEKRSNESDEILLEETTILLDIEGTTTSISFVKDKLFPYVRENLKKYIDEKWSQDEFKADLEKLKEQAKKDEEAKVSGFLPISGASPEEEKDSLVKNVLWQMDEDRKTGALKQLQGHMWRNAYETGEIKGHVYDDVPKALESWTNGGRKIYIYSSGSVESQKLLFSHSQNNDLTKYLSGYFDTEVGDKQEANSYKNILNKINVPASSVLFLTDVVKEAKAAKEAGLSATLVIREGNAPISDEEKSSFTTIKSFDDLSFKILSKRQKIDADDEKKDSKVSEPAKTDVAEKTEPKEKSQVDAKTDNEKPCEPMDTSDDISEKNTENKTAKVTDNESKDVTEPEQKEKETEKEKEKENVKEKEQVPEKMTVDDSKESTDAKSEKSNDEVKKVTEEKKTEEKMSVDEPTTKTKEAEKKIDEPVVETVKKTLPDDKKETVVESNTKTEEKTEKSETEAKKETVEKPKEVEEKKVETPTTEEKKSTTEETKATETKDKIPEIVVDKAPEIEKETEKPEVKENGGVKEEKPAETETKKEVEQPELRSEKPAEEKEKEKEKIEEKEEVKKDEVEKKKEEESKVNGTSNGEGKHSNGVDEKEKPETKTTVDPTSSQNGDAETADSAEAIKVKKVVDSTVADGAGEPEVVTPPVAVAATS